MPFRLGPSSRQKLEGVHPHLVAIVERAIEISTVDFRVIEGLRTVERQRELVKSGASTTMNSRHIRADNGLGHAVDIVPLVNGKVSWDWPLFYPIAAAMKQAAKELGLKLEWGGDWKSFKDGPHWQLPWKPYASGAKAVAFEKPISSRTTSQANNQEATAIGAAGSVSGGVVAGDSLAAVTDVISGQQHELSSGDWVRIAVALVILGLTVWGVMSKLRSKQ
jgi:peptidoglycan L-alanyl-D-glutamate endopeptidase CwlK